MPAPGMAPRLPAHLKEESGMNDADRAALAAAQTTLERRAAGYAQAGEELAEKLRTDPRHADIEVQQWLAYQRSVTAGMIYDASKLEGLALGGWTAPITSTALDRGIAALTVEADWLRHWAASATTAEQRTELEHRADVAERQAATVRELRDRLERHYLGGQPYQAEQGSDLEAER
jgi:hypothetical protein